MKSLKTCTRKGAVMSVRNTRGETCEFPMTTSLHQGLSLSPYLFTLIIDELIAHIHEEVSWCIVFLDDIVSIGR